MQGGPLTRAQARAAAIAHLEGRIAALDAASTPERRADLRLALERLRRDGRPD